MATEVPAPIEAPSVFGDDWREKEEAYFAEMKAMARKANARPGRMREGLLDLIGEVLRWPRADGYAVYMVWNVYPLEIVHLAVGDAWSIEPALIRGLNVAEVRRMVEHERAMKEMFEGPNRWYSKDKVGQIVHYHNGFGQYVRCEVVEADSIRNLSDGKAIGGVALKPIALVGQWREFDLPRRKPNGEINYPYHAKSVVEGELMQPNASNLYEYDGFHDRLGIDPRGLEPIDLTPPGMSPEDERRAALVKRIDRVRAAIENADPANETSLLAALVDIHTITEQF